MAKKTDPPDLPVKPKHKRPTPEQLDQRLVIDRKIDAETVIEAIAQVDPKSEPVKKPKGAPAKRV